MATTGKITQVGNSLGIVLPKDVLTELAVGKGDTLHFVPQNGGVFLTPYQPGFDAKIAVFEEVMRENRDVLRKLAE